MSPERAYLGRPVTDEFNARCAVDETLRQETVFSPHETEEEIGHGPRNSHQAF